MDAAGKEVERLLQSTTVSRQDFEEFKNKAQAKSSHVFESWDKRIQTLDSKTKKLTESTQSLSNDVANCDKRLAVLQAERCQANDAGKDATDLVQAGETLGQLQNILTVRNNPAATLESMRIPPVSFTIVGFKERRKNNDVLYTEPFRSHPYGYKMCLKVYFNGRDDGKGTHISVYCMLLPGEFDEILEWPFSGQLVVQLINQRKDKLHHSKTIALYDGNADLKYRQKPNAKDHTDPKDRPSWGFSKFVPHADLPAKGFLADQEYLKNDTLVFRVYKVDIYNLRY